MAETRHTPGPWRWELNLKHKTLQLCGGVPRFDLTVLDFQRWGMSGATVRLRNSENGHSMMRPASQFATAVAGREHHADWFQGLDHPDAHLIAAAPELLEAAAGLLKLIGHGAGGPFKPDPAGTYNERVEALFAAIAKAEGR